MVEIRCFTENSCAENCPVGGLANRAEEVVPLIRKCIEVSKPFGPMRFGEAVVSGPDFMELWEDMAAFSPEERAEIFEAASRHITPLCVETVKAN
jgi:hypothetical protein